MVFSIPRMAAAALLASSTIALFSAPVSAQEPQRTSATYQDWTVQCRLFKQAAVTSTQAEKKKSADKKKKADADKKKKKKAEKAPLPPKDERATSRVCEMVQRFTVRQTGRRFGSLAIGKLPGEKDIKAVLQVPLDVYLPAGTVLKIDDKKDVKGVYVRCTRSACLADIPLSKEDLDKLSGGAKASVVFSNLARRAVTLSVSTRGFSGAMKAMLADGS